MATTGAAIRPRSVSTPLTASPSTAIERDPAALDEPGPESPGGGQEPGRGPRRVGVAGLRFVRPDRQAVGDGARDEAGDLGRARRPGPGPRDPAPRRCWRASAPRAPPASRAGTRSARSPGRPPRRAPPMSGNTGTTARRAASRSRGRSASGRSRTTGRSRPPPPSRVRRRRPTPHAARGGTRGWRPGRPPRRRRHRPSRSCPDQPARSASQPSWTMAVAAARSGPGSRSSSRWRTRARSRLRASATPSPGAAPADVSRRCSSA